MSFPNCPNPNIHKETYHAACIPPRHWHVRIMCLNGPMPMIRNHNSHAHSITSPRSIITLLLYRRKIIIRDWASSPANIASSKTNKATSPTNTNQPHSHHLSLKNFPLSNKRVIARSSHIHTKTPYLLRDRRVSEAVRKNVVPPLPNSYYIRQKKITHMKVWCHEAAPKEKKHRSPVGQMHTIKTHHPIHNLQKRRENNSRIIPSGHHPMRKNKKKKKKIHQNNLKNQFLLPHQV